MEDFNIYFSDLKEESQRRLMEAVGITDPREMNWDIDMLPLATYPIPINEEEQKSVMDEMKIKTPSLFLPHMLCWKKNVLTFDCGVLYDSKHYCRRI